MISEGHGDGWLRRRGFWLEYASIAWMIVEAATAITAGIIASSIALTGFGLDSVIELAAAVIVVWQHRGAGGHPNIAAVEAPQIVVRRLLSQR